MENNKKQDEKTPTPAIKECDENVLEPMLTIGFVLNGPTTDIYRVTKAFGDTLAEHTAVKLVYKRSSLGKLWIVDEGESR